MRVVLSMRAVCISRVASGILRDMMAIDGVLLHISLFSAGQNYCIAWMEVCYSCCCWLYEYRESGHEQCNVALCCAV